ncbi:MAG: response regulator [Chlamydiota bacterium]|nr:response regulator [Chlamydiota bacterium]
MRIILIDDDEDFCDIFCWKVKKYVDVIDCVLDTSSGLKMLQDAKYDLLAIDVNLPEVKGYDFIKEIKKMGLLPPRVIMLSGIVIDEEKEIAMNFGVDEYLEKDFNFNFLTNILDMANEKRVYR